MDYQINKSKRLKNIYPLLFSAENLVASQMSAQKGKGNRSEVRRFNKNVIDHLQQLHNLLYDETYETGKYRIKIITEPKERLIMIAPYYPDRVLHHCIINILGETWTKVFINNTYACIKGRGIHKCLNDIKSVLKKDRKGTKYCLKLDIKKFYDNVNHASLKRIIRYKIADEQMLRLLDKIVDSNGESKGLPIGNFTSQYMANLYLSYFDHFVKEDLMIKYYYRYMDDIVILHSDKDKLRYYLDMMGLYLASQLKLEIKENWQIFPVDSRSIDFVGFKNNHHGVLLRKSILKRFYRKYERISKTQKINDLETFKQLFPSEYGWIINCSDEHINYIFNKFKKDGKTKRT